MPSPDAAGTITWYTGSTESALNGGGIAVGLVAVPFTRWGARRAAGAGAVLRGGSSVVVRLSLGMERTPSQGLFQRVIKRVIHRRRSDSKVLLNNPSDDQSPLDAPPCPMLPNGVEAWKVDPRHWDALSPKGVGEGRNGINIWICTPSSYPDYKLSDSPKGVGEGLISGFAPLPLTLITN